MSLLKKIAKKIVKKIYYPKDIVKNRVIFESNGPYDNSYTMFLYAVKNRPDLDSYFYCPDFVIKGSNLNKRIKKFSSKGKRKVERFLSSHRLNGLIYGAKTIFSSYYLIKPINAKTKYVYLGHGIGIKAVKKFLDNVFSSGCDIVYPSLAAEKIYRSFYTHNSNKTIISGMPRTDELLIKQNKMNIFTKMIGNDDGCKTVLMMVTFRRNINGSLNDNYILPPFIELHSLNVLLQKLKIRLVIKLHHTLDNVDDSNLSNESNIVFLKNKKLFECGFNTTSVVPYFDAFLTDYSSSATDFILVDKQIGFFTFDIGSYYGVNQGFTVKNPLSFLPGIHINNYEELCSFFQSVCDNVDDYSNDRKKVSMVLNGFSTPPGDCSKKLLELYYPAKNGLIKN